MDLMLANRNSVERVSIDAVGRRTCFCAISLHEMREVSKSTICHWESSPPVLAGYQL